VFGRALERRAFVGWWNWKANCEALNFGDRLAEIVDIQKWMWISNFGKEDLKGDRYFREFKQKNPF
jgi:hypothetical protein